MKVFLILVWNEEWVEDDYIVVGLFERVKGESQTGRLRKRRAGTVGLFL